MNVKRALTRFLLFALLGLLLEVFLGAGQHLYRGDWNLRGSTSPWMMLDYGLLGLVVMPLARLLSRGGFPLAARALVYMLGIFLVEYVSGTVFTWCGLQIWSYRDLPYNLHGQIALVFVVPWYLLGLSAEFLNRKLDACAVTLVRGFTAEQLEQIKL